MLNRYWPTVLALLAAVVLGWYLLYTELLMREMRRDALVHSSIYLEILQGLSDPRPGAADQTLLTLIDEVANAPTPDDPDEPPSSPQQLSLF